VLYALFFCSVDVFLLYSHSHINTQFKPLELGSDLKYIIIKYMFFLTVGISLVKWRNDMSHFKSFTLIFFFQSEQFEIHSFFRKFLFIQLNIHSN